MCGIIAKIGERNGTMSSLEKNCKFGTIVYE